MDELLDPNSPSDYETQATTIARQRKVAELLRAQAGGQPQGQMVSGRFVKPGALALLAPLIGQLNASSIENRADQGEREYAQRAAKDRDKWSSALPQAIAARAEQQGPRAENGSPELDAQPAQPLTTGRILKYAMEGRRIPGNEKNVDMTTRMLGDELTREDNQAARKDTQAAANALAREKLVETLQMQREKLTNEIKQAGDNAALKRELQSKHDAVLLQIAEMSAEAKKTAAAGKVTHLPAAQTTAYLGNKGTIGGVKEALNLLTQNPKAVGLKGLAPNVVLSRHGTPGEKATRAAIANIGSLKLHDRSGATVTVAESPRLLPFIPTVNDDADAAAIKLKGLMREAERMNLSIEEFAVENMYHRPGTTTVTPDDNAPNTPAADPNTKTIGGKTYVKRGEQWYPQ